MNFLDIFKKGFSGKEDSTLAVVREFTNYVLGDTTNNQRLFTQQDIETANDFFTRVSQSRVQNFAVPPSSDAGDADNQFEQFSSYIRLQAVKSVWEHLEPQFLAENFEHKILAYELQVYSSNLGSRLEELTLTENTVAQLLKATVENNCHGLSYCWQLHRFVETKINDSLSIATEIRKQLSQKETNNMRRMILVRQKLSNRAILSKKLKTLKLFKDSTQGIYQTSPDLLATLKCIADNQRKLSEPDTNNALLRKLVCLNNLRSVCQQRLHSVLKEVIQRTRSLLLKSQGVLDKATTIQVVSIFLFLEHRFNKIGFLQNTLKQTSSGFTQSLQSQIGTASEDVDKIVKALEMCTYILFNVDSFSKILKNPPLQYLSKTAQLILRDRNEVFTKYCTTIHILFQQISKQTWQATLNIVNRLCSTGLAINNQSAKKQKIVRASRNWAKKISQLNSDFDSSSFLKQLTLIN